MKFEALDVNDFLAEPDDDSDVPTLDAYAHVETDTLHVWCIYCKRAHVHGRLDGHRAAHCTSDSPYKETGYYIQEVGMLPPRQRTLTKPLTKSIADETQ